MERWFFGWVESLRRLMENCLIDTAYVLAYFSDAFDRAAVPTSRSVTRSIKSLRNFDEISEKARLNPWIVLAAISVVALLY